MSQGPVLRKYAVQTTINFVLFEIDGVDFRVDAVDSGANCTIMKNEGAEATCTNDFADEGTGYSLVLDATEMTAARIVVYVIDAATKVWLDTSIIIETYGNASAMHAFDLDTATQNVNIASTNDIDFSATQKASINTEADLALSDINLDHFVGTSSGIPALPAGTYLDLLQDDGTATYSRTTDSLQAIRDHATTIKAETALIVADTNELQVDDTPGAIAGLNDISTAQVNTEVDNAIVTYGLDHLVQVSVTGTDIADNSIIAKLVDDAATADWDGYDPTTASLEALNVDTDAIKAETALIVADTDVIDDGTSGLVKIASDVAAILVDTGTTLQAELDGIQADTEDLQTQIGTAGAGLSDLGGMSTGMKAEVESEANDALVAMHLDHLFLTAVADEIVDSTFAADLVSKTGDWSTFDKTADALEAIRDRGDAAWTTGAAGTGLTPLDSGTLRAGGSSTQALLPTARTFADDILNGTVINLLTGTGAGQSRVIIDYALSGDIATVSPAWTTNPDATTTYEIVQGTVNLELWQLVQPNALSSGLVGTNVNRWNGTAVTLGSGAPDVNIQSADADTITASALATDAVNEIRDAILPKTNTALSDITFFMADDTDHITAKTGLSPSVERSIDAGAFAAGSNSVAEVSDGIYQYDASTSRMNGAMIMFRFFAAGADDTFVLVRTGG